MLGLRVHRHIGAVHQQRGVDQVAFAVGERDGGVAALAVAGGGRVDGLGELETEGGEIHLRFLLGAAWEGAAQFEFTVRGHQVLGAALQGTGGI